jgi:predicted transcriptional regulator
MATITLELSGPAAEKLRQLVEVEQRSEIEIVRDALEAYAPSQRRLPKGTGKYHSGRTDVSQTVEEILRDAVKEGQWP